MTEKNVELYKKIVEEHGPNLEFFETTAIASFRGEIDKRRVLIQFLYEQEGDNAIYASVYSTTYLHSLEDMPVMHRELSEIRAFLKSRGHNNPQFLVERGRSKFASPLIGYNYTQRARSTKGIARLVKNFSDVLELKLDGFEADRRVMKFDPVF